MAPEVQKILVNGQWRAADATETFRAVDPSSTEFLADLYPVSSWSDCDVALDAAAKAAKEMRCASPESIGDFLDDYASRIDAAVEPIVSAAHLETALPSSQRFAQVELPRTTNQLRQAAVAAREGSWAMATIDSHNNIRSQFAPIGPVSVFGPNNFPLAFNSVAGGDFAAAIAAGNPVIAKAHSSHPTTTRLLAEAAHAAAQESGLPSAVIQLIYRTSHADGERLVSDPRIGATGYTGSRSAGLRLKAAADAAGKPIYLELSSVNPVVILPGALRDRSAEIAEEFTSSCLMGSGQFCTNPGLVVLLQGPETDVLIDDVKNRFQNAPVGTLLGPGVETSLRCGIDIIRSAGAELLTRHQEGSGKGFSHANTLLCVRGTKFLQRAAAFQTEAFGNAALIVLAEDIDEICNIVDVLEGNLTGCLYSAMDGQDDANYDRVAGHLRHRVGRLLNDKMPTGVALSPAMNHGGPYPATGHPGFTAIGIPPSLRRFASLQCYEGVRPHRLPPLLRDKNPTGCTWRSIDGNWTTADVCGERSLPV